MSIAITELELAIMGFVGCALIMYLLWWHKPFALEESVVITCPYRNREEEIIETRYTSKFRSHGWDEFCKSGQIPNWAYLDDLGLGNWFSFSELLC